MIIGYKTPLRNLMKITFLYTFVSPLIKHCRLAYRISCVSHVILHKYSKRTVFLISHTNKHSSVHNKNKLKIYFIQSDAQV